MDKRRDPIAESVLRQVKRSGDASKEAAGRVRATLFAQQLTVLDDPKFYKSLLCPRRAGKSWSIAACLVITALLNPDSTSLYVSLSLGQARKNFWTPVLLKLLRECRVECAKNGSTCTVEFPNGSRIMLQGADDERDVEMVRGGAYHLIVVDECGSIYPNVLETFVKKVALPAFMDHRGTLVLAGTPGWMPQGLFFEATTSDGRFSRHRWQVQQNPHLKDPLAYLAEIRGMWGYTEESPVYRQEYLGEWCLDDTRLVYKFDERRNVWPGKGLPEGHEWYRVLGVDLGKRDATALSLWAYSHTHRDAFEIVSVKKSGLRGVTEIVRFMKTLELAEGPFDQIVVDEGALGVVIADEMRDRFGIHCKPAKKGTKQNPKGYYIRLMNGDLIDGRLWVRKDSPLVEEWRALEYDDNGKEHSKFENHCADAALYAWLELRNFNAEAPTAGPEKGTDEYWQRYAAEMEQREVDRYRQMEQDEDDLFPRPPGEVW